MPPEIVIAVGGALALLGVSLVLKTYVVDPVRARRLLARLESRGFRPVDVSRKDLLASLQSLGQDDTVAFMVTQRRPDGATRHLADVRTVTRDSQETSYGSLTLLVELRELPVDAELLISPRFTGLLGSFANDLIARAGLGRSGRSVTGLLPEFEGGFSAQATGDGEAGLPEDLQRALLGSRSGFPLNDPNRNAVRIRLFPHGLSISCRRIVKQADLDGLLSLADGLSEGLAA